MRALVAALLALGCETTGRSEVAKSSAACPCECGERPVAAEVSAPAEATPRSTTSSSSSNVGASSADVVASAPAGSQAVDLVAEIHRKMLRGDGAGCLADFEELVRRDRGLATRLVAVDAQCRMLVGRCQEGKRLLVDYYREEMAMGPERSAAVAESIASMRCREGDSTPRDRFLRAHQELTEAAYVERRSSDYCRARTELLTELAPRVSPKDALDTAVSGAKQALFYTASACFVRAGDCASARRVFSELFPRENFGGNVTTEQAKTLIETAFTSSHVLCAAPN